MDHRNKRSNELSSLKEIKTFYKVSLTAWITYQIQDQIIKIFNHNHGHKNGCENYNTDNIPHTSIVES